MSEKPRRRPRYRGTHPRRFEEKYKELDPERYSGEAAKVQARGGTPAGTHRPIMVREVLAVLSPRPGETAVDCTLGHGGHALELLAAVQPGGRLLAVDRDPIELPKAQARLRALGFPEESFVVRRMNFAGLPALLEGRGADVVFADLGASSMQLDDPARGFTFKFDAPLDMRMDPRRGLPAAERISRAGEGQIARWLYEFGDEPHARELSAAIAAAAPIGTTGRLAGVVREALSRVPGRRDEEEIETAVRRVFQAIRIAVNDELGALDELLRVLPACLAPGGRFAVLTFHSGEDRRVKHAFEGGIEAGVYSEVAREVGRASAEEERANPRSRPAKLRWAIRR